MVPKSPSKFLKGGRCRAQYLYPIFALDFQFARQGFSSFQGSFFIFIFEDDACEKSMGWVMKHLSNRILMLEQLIQILTNGTFDGVVLRLSSLQCDPSGCVSPTSPARNLA